VGETATRYTAHGSVPPSWYAPRVGLIAFVRDFVMRAVGRVHRSSSRRQPASFFERGLAEVLGAHARATLLKMLTKGEREPARFDLATAPRLPVICWRSISALLADIDGKEPGYVLERLEAAVGLALGNLREDVAGRGEFSIRFVGMESMDSPPAYVGAVVAEERVARWEVTE
jgi:hypothetical protein